MAEVDGRAAVAREASVERAVASEAGDGEVLPGSIHAPRAGARDEDLPVRLEGDGGGGAEAEVDRGEPVGRETPVEPAVGQVARDGEQLVVLRVVPAEGHADGDDLAVRLHGHLVGPARVIPREHRAHHAVSAEAPIESPVL